MDTAALRKLGYLGPSIFSTEKQLQRDQAEIARLAILVEQVKNPCERRAYRGWLSHFGFELWELSWWAHREPKIQKVLEGMEKLK